MPQPPVVPLDDFLRDVHERFRFDDFTEIEVAARWIYERYRVCYPNSNVSFRTGNA